MKRIVIDNSNLFTGGGIQVAASFLDDLRNISDEFEFVFHVIQSANCAKAIDESMFSNKFIFHRLDSARNQFEKIRKVKQIENEVHPEVIFTTFGPSYHKSNFPKIVGFAIPYIVYSDSPFFEKISWKERWKYKIMGYLKTHFFKKNSDALVFESQVARDVFVQKTGYKNRTYVVNNTLNSVFLCPHTWIEQEIKKSQLDIFCLSANYPHKNLNIIPFVIEEILKEQSDLQFLFHISGQAEQFDFSAEYSKYLNFMGTIERQKLPFIYQQMDLLFLPTLLEVFSTTYLEAMFMQVPIVTSDMPFSREVCGQAALYAKPTDANDYAQKILSIYKDKLVADQLIQNGKIALKKYGSSMDRTHAYLKIIQNYASDKK